MMLEHRPDGAQINGCIIGHEKDGVRIAHIDHRRTRQHRFVGGTDHQFDAARIGKILRQRNFLPAQTRLAHIDGEGQRPVAAAGQQSGLGFQHHAVVAAVFQQSPCDTARAVAAGTRQRAVTIENLHERRRARGLRIGQHHQLVKPRLRAFGNGARIFGPHH